MNANIIHFDVEHGDSILIELTYDSKEYYIIIDSNYTRRGSKSIVPAHEYLKNKNVTQVAAVILTHLHADHYLGLEDIFNHYDVKKVIIPPFLSRREDIYTTQVHNLKKKIAELVDRSPDEEIGRRAYSLAEIIAFLSNNDDKIVEGEGTEMPVRIDGIPTPIGRVFLPMRRIKGLIRQAIENGDFELDSFENMNDSSVVFCLELDEHKILFGADSTLEQWKEHERALNRDGIKNLKVDTLKAPHHGSRHNNNLDIYNYVLKPNSPNNLVISANGRTHPHNEIFNLITQKDLKPYCTRIAKQCLGNIRSITALNKVKKELRNVLSNYDIEDDSQQCQGDISYSISGTQVQFYSSTGNQCVYRATTPALQKTVL